MENVLVSNPYIAGGGGNLIEKSVLINDNGDHYYYASSDSADGYSSVNVTVDVPINVAPKSSTITSNGWFYASTEGRVGYSSVQVQVPVNVGSVIKNLYSNGEFLYNASYDGYQGYSSFTLDVAQPTPSLYKHTFGYWDQSTNTLVNTRGDLSRLEIQDYKSLPNPDIAFGKIATCACANRTSLSYAWIEAISEIGDYAFYGCSNLNNIILSADLVSIGDYALKDSSVYYITYRGTVADWGNVQLGQGWHDNTRAWQVQCSDGNVRL